MGDDWEWTKKKIVEYRVPDFLDGEVKRLREKISELEEELKSRPSTEYVEVLERRLKKKQEDNNPEYQAYAVHDGANAKVEVGGTYISGRTLWDLIAETDFSLARTMIIAAIVGTIIGCPMGYGIGMLATKLLR